MIDFEELDEVEDTGEEGCLTSAEETAERASRADEASPTQITPDAAAVLRNGAGQSEDCAEVGSCEPHKEQYWKVVHSADAGGLAVQAKEDKMSPTVGRLGVGTAVVELQRSGNRLNYRREPGVGSGPLMGWVSIKAAGPWGKECLRCLGDYKAWQASLAPPTQAESQAQQALILLDWDDTLCPTTWIKQRPPGPLAELRESAVWAQLEEQARAVVELIRAAQSLGSVALVTLADPAWVEIACRDYLPGASSVVAALDAFYADNQNVALLRAGANLDICTVQKKRSMESVLSTFSSRVGPRAVWRSLISIGDSEAERGAARDLGRERKATGEVLWTKTVKLMEHPDIGELTEQVRRVIRLLPELVALESSRSVDLVDSESISY